MKVKELIQELVNYDMNADIECSISNEVTETTTISYRRCGIQIFYDNYSNDVVRIHFEEGRDRSDV